jgi:transposase
MTQNRLYLLRRLSGGVGPEGAWIVNAMVRCCAGLDVHARSVVACVRALDGAGKVSLQTRTFETHSAALMDLAGWLASQGVEQAAMESTGVYWKPVWNILEQHGLSLMLVNAWEFRNVPGRKTDINDAQWLAQLLQHGLLRASFVPERRVRELRDLTRHRTCLTQDKTRVANRIQKVLEDANIKLSSVASDVLGMSGRAMIQALIQGEHVPEKIADLARGRLKAKRPQLCEALRGGANDHHRFMLKLLMDQLAELEQLIARLQTRIDELTAQDEAIIERLDAIPGIDRTVAQVVLAEIGTQMKHFPTAGHLASWAKLRPGDDESAGKRRSSKTGRGNRWLKGALTQAAWAAGRTKKSSFSSQLRRIASRRGIKRALVAVAHSLVVVIYHMLARSTNYQDLGHDYYDNLAPTRLTNSLVRRLQSLGHNVTLSPKTAA